MGKATIRIRRQMDDVNYAAEMAAVNDNGNLVNLGVDNVTILS